MVFRKKLSRSQFLVFLAAQPRCTVAMEACATAHGWGREIGRLGHEVRLIPPIYVKPFVKRQKNDVADAEAIAEAASRPTMRFVAVKSEEQQARSMIFRTRDLLVRQRTQLINALRGHLAEHGVVAPQGTAHVKRLADVIGDETAALPATVRQIGRLYLEQIDAFSGMIDELEKRSIPVLDLYFAEDGRRYRSLGCAPCTGTIASNATTVDAIIEELRATKQSERAGRAQDQESEDAFERLRQDGYM